MASPARHSNDRTLLAPDMTIAQARRALTDTFAKAGLDAPELDARLLTGHALGLDHTALTIEGERLLGDDTARALAALAARRLDREPIARILGVKEFWGLPFRLNDATLVPRPETETLVEVSLGALDESGSRHRALRIADLGTGSGAILIALLAELPNATGIGIDVSPQAVTAARDNAACLGLTSRAQFAVGDFGAALAGSFDLIVSNPPYVESNLIATLPPEVRRDPRRALDGGADGLDAYRTIAGQTRKLLGPGGHLVVELGVGQESAVAGIFRAAGLTSPSAQPDLSGVPRALRARVATITP
jgi:release factor glutamine methyltransferase